MPLANRAAQFAPFAAVTGHNEAAHDTEQMHIASIDVETEDEDWML